MEDLTSFGANELVRVKPLKNSRRDFLYRGWVGRIVRFRGEEPDMEAFVDTDGYHRVQAVTFCDWFRLDELEHFEPSTEGSLGKETE